MQHDLNESTNMTHTGLHRRETPIILVANQIDKNYVSLQTMIEPWGWDLQLSKTALDTSRIALKQAVSLVLLDLDRASAVSLESARVLRSLAAPSAAAPILALRSSPTKIDPIPIHVDAVIDRNTSLDSLVQQLECWRPVSLEPTRRIAKMFGPGPIAGMIERLARRLEPALANIEHGIIDRSEAHRLAGLCGTLGFGRAHAAWLDLSLGDDSVVSDVRRTTRLVLSAVARGL